MKREAQNRAKAGNITYCGIICAMTMLVLFGGIVPSMTYVMPALSGIVIWSVSRQAGRNWAFLTYAAAALLSLFLIPEMESKTFFIMFFGYYPLLREPISRISFPPARFLVKLTVFNIAAVISYFAVVYIFGINDMLNDLEGFGEYAVYVFWGMGNAAFFFYDFALKYVFYAFDFWLKPIIDKKIR